MFYVAKVIRRAILLWVFYGAFRLYLLAIPLLAQLFYIVAKYMNPKNIDMQETPEILASVAGLIFVVITFMILVVILGTCNRFARWIFNEKELDK